jgi:outer membrane protein assembly factor BamB
MNQYPSLRRWFAAVVTLVVLVAVIVLLPRSGSSPSGDIQAADAAPERGWPLFGGSASRNMVNTFEKNLPTDWSVAEGERKNIKWIAELGSKAYGGPVVANGKVFIGTNNEKPRDPKLTGDKGVLMCFREADGKFLWQFAFDKLAAGRVNDWPYEGICSTPIIDGNKLYFINNRAEVICCGMDGGPDGTPPAITWKLDMIKQLGVFPHNLATCSPLIVGDTLFLVTSNGVDEGHINIPKPEAPSFIALDKKTGKVLWQSNAPSERLVEAQKSGGKEVDVKQMLDKGLIIMHGQWSNPVYAEVNGKPQVIFPGGDGWLHALNPKTGKLIWKFDCNPKSSVYKLGAKGTRSDFLGTPVVYDNKVYIGVGQDPEHDHGVGHFWCIDITKEGDVSPVNDNFDPKAPENKNSALVWHFGGPADPKKIGRNYYFGRTMSTCAVHDGLVYIGELDGYLHCLDAKTGEKYWDENMQSDTWSSPYWVDGKVYMGTDEGQLRIFKDGKQKQLIKAIDMEGPIRATPVAANGVLYVMTENKLYAIK